MVYALVLRNSIKNGCFFIFLTTWLTGALAQQSQITYSYLNFGVNQGLPSSEVYDLYQDPKNGILWIATDRGLVTYDGYSFTTYTLDDGLTDNVILRMTPDQWGNIWLYTLNNQLCYLDTDRNIRQFKYNEALQKECEANNYFDPKFMALATDKDALFLGMRHCTGRIRISRTGDVDFLNYAFRTPGEKFINFSPGNDFFYFSSSPKTTHSYPVNDLKGSTIHTINDSLLLLTDEYKIQLYNGAELQKEIISENMITCSGKLNDSLFWVSYLSGGVDLFSADGKLINHLLADKVISDVLQDSEGGIWFSTLSNGIFYLKNTRIESFLFNSSERLFSIAAMGDQLFLGYYNGDVFTMNTHTFECTAYADFETEFPVMLHCDTLRKVVYFSNASFLGWSDLRSKNKTILPYGTVRISDSQNSNDVFFGSYGSFVTRTAESILVTYTPFRVKDVTTFQNDIVLAAHTGLYAYADSTFTKIDRKELNFRIEDVDQFRDGLICASLGGGVIFYNADTLFSIKKANGLLSNLTTEVFIENDSTIWLATTAGVNKICFDENYNYTVSGYTISDGLISNEVVDIDMTPGYIWIATKGGLNRIPKNDVPEIEKPDLFLAITHVHVNGKKIALTNNRLDLKHDANNIEVHFNAISFSRNESLKYRYRLIQKKDNWLYTANRSVVFPSLPSGLHRLEVQASTGTVNWSDPVLLEISIAPPFWKTWWFIAGLLLIFALGIFAVFVNRLRREKLKINALEMEMKALRAQMNPHFIFNALASIQHFILKGNSDDSNKYLTKFSKLMRGVLENSKTELVSIRKEVDMLQLYVELEQLRVKPFDYVVLIDPLVDSNILQIPPLLIQPFIENAIWHGIEPAAQKCTLLLEITIRENKLHCIIDDNGVGRTNSKDLQKNVMRSKGKSFGIEITRERIEALKKTQGVEVTVVITDKSDPTNQPAGTRIELSIPLLKST